MSVKKLLEANGIETKNIPKNEIHTMEAPSREEIIEAYPPTSEIGNTTSSTEYITQCGSKKVPIIHHPRYRRPNGPSNYCSVADRMVGKRDGKYYYHWRGDSLLVSPKLIPIEIFEEINAAKDAELEKSKKNRIKQIKTPLDAVRAILAELGYRSSRHEQSLRVHILGACHMQFYIKEPYDVTVKFGYYTGGYGGPCHADVTKLNLADPEFNAKVSSIMCRATNITNFIAGCPLVQHEKNEDGYIVM